MSVNGTILASSEHRYCNRSSCFSKRFSSCGFQKIADDLIDQFNIGKETTRVALYKYSSDAVMIREFGLGK